MADQAAKTQETVLRVGGFEIRESNFADVAEKQSFPRDLTTTKLRNIYAQIVNLSTKVADAKNDSAANGTKLPPFNEVGKGGLQYLKVKMTYEQGRKGNEAVDKFIRESYLKDLLSQIDTYDKFDLYCNYAEALVAYAKFNEIAKSDK